MKELSSKTYQRPDIHTADYLTAHKSFGTSHATIYFKSGWINIEGEPTLPEREAIVAWARGLLGIPLEHHDTVYGRIWPATTTE